MEDGMTGRDAPYSIRNLDRRDLLGFLSGHLLGFALDDFFDGAYLGAFDAGGSPSGFIFTGHERDGDEVLIGVPHATREVPDQRELELMLVKEAVRAVSPRAGTIRAAVYSDQDREDRARLQDVYRAAGFRFFRDSTILSRSLEDVVPPEDGLQTLDIDRTGPERMASIARDCAGRTVWAEIDFDAYLSSWSSGSNFDAGLFRVVMQEGEPAGVMVARQDSLDAGEGAFYFLGVLPRFRRRGIGTAILTTGLSLLREKGCTRTRQTIPASDGPALMMLEKAGYRVFDWARYFQLDRS